MLYKLSKEHGYTVEELLRSKERHSLNDDQLKETLKIASKYNQSLRNVKEGLEIIKNKYKCIHCNKIVERDSCKKWIKSYCEETCKNVRLQIIKK